MGIRLLPLIVIISLAMLGVKLVDIFQRNDVLSALSLVSETGAAEGNSADAQKKAKNDDEPEKNVAPQAQEGGGKAPAKDTDAESPEVPSYTEEELKILQNLSERRKELEARERDLNLQAVVLKAAAAKMEERAAEIKQLEEEAKAILKEYQKKDDAKIQSLVKIYENMKPQDAARIFEKMEMPILLQVVGNMKEAKAAPILAKMDPSQAKELSVALAERHKLSEPDNSYRN